MHTVYVDPPAGDESLRAAVYGGQLVVLSPRRSVTALVEFARAMVEAAFAPHHPLEAQFHLTVQEWVDTFAPVKPAFIHHPHTMELLRDVLDELGLDLEQWFLDVPRLRGVTSDGYLTTGVGYAHHPHRDTWYSAPMAQINWWFPLYDFATEASMAFHPRYWNEGVDNESNQFDYYEWNANGRKDAAKMIGKDTRKQPHATNPIDLDPQVRIVMPVGGILLFSGAQMHSTVPNTSGRSRFSVDFRTAHVGDLGASTGAANVDSGPSGTSLRDFRRARDLAPMPDEIVRQYDSAEPADGVLVFDPSLS